MYNFQCLKRSVKNGLVKTTTPQQKMKALALNNLSMSSRILIMKIKKKRQTKSLKGLNFASIMIKIVPKNYAD